MERGLIDHLAMNGAGPIHDWEFALIGATTESVARYIQSGEFGLWRETGRMNDVIREASRLGLGLGEGLGRMILEEKFPHADISILAAGVRLGIPVTVHAGIGYDILHEHPNCDGAALGETSYRDFLAFAQSVTRLEGGVLLNFGSAVMGPEVYLKALAMAQRRASRRTSHPSFHDRRFRSRSAGRRHPPASSQDRSALLLSAVENHPGSHRGRWRRELLHPGRPPRYRPASSPCGFASRAAGGRVGEATMSGLTLDTPKLEKILQRISSLRIGVVGDLFLDRYLDLDSSLTEPSLETGLDAYQVVNVRPSPGAAGTVINNLVALGVGLVHPIAVLGDDGEGYELRQALDRQKIVVPHGLLLAPDRRTPTYTKPMLCQKGASPRELNRLDIKNRQPLPPALEARIMQHIELVWPRIDALVVLDQVSESDCGVVTAAVRAHLCEWAKKHPGTFVLVDSRERIGLFRGMCLKPNRHEALRAGDASGSDGDSVLETVVTNLARRAARWVFCTDGAHGTLLGSPFEDPASPPKRIPAYPVSSPLDIVGAGDSTSAGIVCAMACGVSVEAAAAFGNLVASITIQQLGTTGTATPAQVRERWREVN